jgi:EAL domain-containing protein (putative c-di-GMP-specific phosphodiesterase class I)
MRVRDRRGVGEGAARSTWLAALGLRVVAEGVESPDVRGRLTTLGCDQAQGYSFSRALPQADFAAWLTARELSELALSA